MPRTRFLIFALLISCVPLWCQVEPSATGGSGTGDDDSMMTLPPQISGSFYPSETGGERRENVMTAGVLFTAGYDDNILAGLETHAISAESFVVRPEISIATMTSRVRGSLTYSPGVMYFHPTTELNEVTQNAVADFSYRWTPHTIVGVQEVFQQNSTALSQPYTLAGATLSATGALEGTEIINSYAGQWSDMTSGHMGYQFSRSSMVSASGYFSSYNFSSNANTLGLYDSIGGGGAAAYTRRMSRTQYLGFSYRYALNNTSTYGVTTTNQFGEAFYSIKLPNNFSLSLTGGPEYTTTSETGQATTHAWDPSGSAGLGWQRPRSNYAINYRRAVTAGWGLFGTFTSDAASALARWQFTQRLAGSVNGNYANTKNATNLVATYTPTGHTLFGRAGVEYKLAEHINLVGEYMHLHNSYYGIPEFSRAPNDDRVSFSINYGFQRPLGR